MTIAALIITKNEEVLLEEVLKSVEWVDEIVVLDSGSTDGTVDIAKKYTGKVFVETDWQGFGIQRQRAQSHIESDWILVIDADEQVTPELRRQIEAVHSRNDKNYVYAVPRLSFVFGRFIRHSGWYPDYVIRLYHRDTGTYGDERVHEKLHFDKSVQVKKLSGDLLHFTYRDMQHYLVKSAHYAAEWATQRQARGQGSSLYQGILHGIACFIKMYFIRAGFLDGKQGFLLALLSGHSTFVKYADLWTRQKSGGDEAIKKL